MPAILGFVGAASVELCRLCVEAGFLRIGVATLKEVPDRNDRAQLRAANLHGTDMIKRWLKQTNCAWAGGCV
jgi:hypothetical protein